MAEKIFYNIIIPSSGERKNAEVRYTFTKPLINKQSDYKFIINKFSLDGLDNPICIPEIKNPQSLKTEEFETVYKVYLTFGYNIWSETIKFTSEIMNNKIYPIKNVEDDYYYNNSDPYFYVYSYDWWIAAINKAISDLVDKFNYEAEDANIIKKPVLSREFPSNYLKLTNIDEVDSSSEIKLLFSMNLKRFINISSVRAPKNTFGIHDECFSPYSSGNDAGTLYANLNEWAPIRALVFTSNSISSNPEYFANGSELIQKTQQLQSEKILMVFNLTASESGSNDQIIYSNNNLLNGDLLDLVDTSNLSNIDIKIWFVDERNNWHPVVLNTHGSGFIRCCFIKN